MMIPGTLFTTRTSISKERKTLTINHWRSQRLARQLYSQSRGEQSCAGGGAIGLRQQQWYCFFCWQDAVMQVTVQEWRKLDRWKPAVHSPQMLLLYQTARVLSGLHFTLALHAHT